MGNSVDKERKEWEKPSKNQQVKVLKEFILSKYKSKTDYKFKLPKKDALSKISNNKGKVEGLGWFTVMDKILGYLPPQDVMNFSLSCKYLYYTLNSDEFWKKYFVNYFLTPEKQAIKMKKKGDNWKLTFFTFFRPLRLIKYEHLALENVLGRGGSGATIYKAKIKNGKLAKAIKTKIAAFKVFKVKDIFKSDHSYQDFVNEITFLSSFHHPQVLRIYGVSIKTIRVGIVCELCTNKSIAEYMKSYIYPKEGQKAPRKLTADEKDRIIKEVALGMNYIHRKGVIHKDLKGDNCLLTDDFAVKVFDFGTCERWSPLNNVLKNKSVSYVGTSRYISPEVVLGKRWDFKRDVFSFGIMMWEILNDDYKPYEKRENIERLVAVDPKLRPRINPSIFKGKWKFYKPLLERCWSANPRFRPQFREILKILNRNIKTQDGKKKK